MREAFKFVVSNNVVSSSEGSGRVVLNALANLTFPFGMSC